MDVTNELSRKAVAHAVCCSGSFYFFLTILHIASANLPPFIPNCVNLGLMMSSALQRSALSYDRMFHYVIGMLGISHSSDGVEDGDIEMGRQNNAHQRSVQHPL